jgi:hypothetical protein
MYLSKSGANIPRFSVPSLPQLEAALNSLSDSVADVSNRAAKSFESSADIRVIDSGDSVFFELNNQTKNYKPTRFEIFYDRFNQRLYVYEGSVSLKINGVEKNIVPTINGKKILLPNSPDFTEEAFFSVGATFSSDNGYVANTNVFKIYVKFDLNAVSEDEKVTLIYHDYTLYEEPTGADAFFLIGEIFNTGGVNYINQKWSSDILQFDATKCIFRITDISEPAQTGQSSLKIRVAPATVKTLDGREIYPDQMSVNTGIEWYVSTDGPEWRAVYIRIAYDEATKTVLNNALAVVVMDSGRYIENTSTVQYEYIGSINTSYDTQSNLYISYIENSCSKVIADPSRLAAPCTFSVQDVTTYPSDGSWPTSSDFRLQITKEKIRDILPDGMEEGVDYIIGVSSEFIALDEFYIYLYVDLDEYGEVKDSETAIQIKIHKYWHADGSGIQRFPIARVITHSFSYEGNQNAKLIEIENYCPELTIHTLGSCPFEVEDASEDYDILKIQVRNGKIENQYPEGMVERGSYYLPIDPDNEWSAVYAVIDLEDFVVASNADSVRFEVFNEYKEDTFEKAYRIISEVSVSSRENNSRYISFVRNYCYEPEVGEVGYCPFKLTDVSGYNEQGEPLNALVRVQNGKVGDFYPYGMFTNTDYVVDLNEVKDTYDLEPPFVYFYIEQFVDISGNLTDITGSNNPTNGLTILLSSTALDKGSRIQRTLIGRVEVEYNGGALSVVPMKTVSLCTVVTTDAPSSCPFLVEKAYSNVISYDKGEYIVGEYIYNFQGTEKYITGVTEIPAGDWIALYIATKLDYKGEIDDDPALNVENTFFYQTFDTYLKSNAFYQYTLAAEIGYYNGTNGKVISWIKNYCPEIKGPGLEGCPFAAVDATTEQSGTGIVVRNGRVGGTENRYPDGMEIDTFYYIPLDTEQSPWYAVYCGMSIDGNGKIIDDQQSVWIETAYEGYLESTDDIHYILLSEIYLGYDEYSVPVVDYIDNKCVVPLSPYDSGLAGGKCLFEVLDWSEPGLLKARVSNGKVEGVYPAGMSPTTDYVFTLNTNTGDRFFAVYFIAALGVDFKKYPGNTSMYFMVTTKYVESTSEELYTLVAEITVSNDSENGEYISYIQNFCDLPKTSINPICPFEILKASNNSPTIRIKNGTVKGVYPNGMSDSSKYFEELGSSPWYAIYLRVKVDEETGFPITAAGSSDISFYTLDNYQNSTAEFKYFLIGEVTISNDSQSGRYVSYIVNACDTPQFLGYGSAGGTSGANSCPFQLVDVSFPTSSGELDLRVKISKGMINNRWPSGMSLTSTDYVLDITGNCYIYAVLGYKTDDIELLEEDTAITFEKTIIPKVNTETIQYELVGTVVISSGGPANGYYISSLTSVCGRIEAKPCSLAWSAGTGS